MNLIIHVDLHIECENNLGERIYYLISHKKVCPQIIKDINIRDTI